MSFPGRELQRCWHLVNAQGQTVGRLANQVSAILKGKHKPTFQPNKDMGDHVVVINADKVRWLKFGDAASMCIRRSTVLHVVDAWRRSSMHLARSSLTHAHPSFPIHRSISPVTNGRKSSIGGTRVIQADSRNARRLKCSNAIRSKFCARPSWAC